MATMDIISKLDLPHHYAGGTVILVSSLTESDIGAFGEWARTRVVRHFILNHALQADGVITALAALIGDRRFPSLRTLDLCLSGFGRIGTRSLMDAARQGHLSTLLHLNLSHNALGVPGMQYLTEVIAAGSLPMLEELELAGVGMGDEGMELLARHGQYLDKLTTLALNANSLTDQAIEILAEELSSNAFPVLANLRLASNAITRVGAELLLGAACDGYLPGLGRLYLDHTLREAGYEERIVAAAAAAASRETGRPE